MPGMLGRSRSLRMLRGGHKETHQRDTESATPQPTLSQVEVERLKATTPVSKNGGSVETAEMLQRPKTSGGPGDRSTLFHKKVPPVQQPGNQGFEFPFPSPTKSTTVLYAAELHEDREGIIGIALGSPTMATHWNTTPQGTDFVTNSPGTITHISSNNQSPNAFPQPIGSHQEAPRPKLSRWKSLFKKTAPPPPPQEKESFYQLARTVTAARADSHHDDESLDSRLDSRSVTQQEDEPRVMSPATYTYNPKIRESRKLPKGYAQPVVDTRPRALTIGVNQATKSKTSLLRSASSPKPPPKDGISNSPTVPQVFVTGGSQTTSPRGPGEKGLLDVDIPTVHMERYSVMFSSFLQQNQGGSSSLLQRRGGNSEKLRPLNELSVKNEEYGSHLKPQRRATSPSFAPKSPSAHLSLFPSANTSRAPSPRTVSVNRPRPLQRSRTAPAISPSRQSFPVHPEVHEGTPSLKSKLVEVETPAFSTTPHSRVSSPSSDRSYDSDSEEITIVVARDAPGQTWKPRIEEKEPQWEILTRKPSNITKASALRSHPATEQPSSAPLEPPSASSTPGLSRTRSQTVLSPAPRSADRITPTVGVARSVSVSRANKPDLLKPTLVNDGAGRFVDSKPLTPTLVELKNRRSQRVQLVDA